MKRTFSRPHALTVALTLGVAALAVPGIYLSSADHLDPPARTNPSVDETPDVAADIADILAWHNDDSIIVALTFAGPQATDQPAVYDRDVRYRINISNASPRTTPDFPIEVRFGEGSGEGEFGVQVTGLPGERMISGPVETNLSLDGIKVRAGLFDDPFFFDSQGFRDTLNTGTLSFDNTRDFFAGQNLTAVVIEIPRDLIENGDNLIDVWGTTARFGGNI